MPHLDDRLKAVARQLRSEVHADIGSDHGHLLKALLAAGRIRRGIAIENKRQPFENSTRTLAGVNAEVRFADGLEGVPHGEANSLSICGMGAETILNILEAFPSRVPPLVVLQPNRCPEVLRAWGLRNGFHLCDEQLVYGHWPYPILRFEQAQDASDPAYEGLGREAALLWGPHLIRRWEPEFVARLREEQRYWSDFKRLGPDNAQRLQLLHEILSGVQQ